MATTLHNNSGLELWCGLCTRNMVGSLHLLPSLPCGHHPPFCIALGQITALLSRQAEQLARAKASTFVAFWVDLACLLYSLVYLDSNIRGSHSCLPVIETIFQLEV